jgi:hypothetical protein
MKRFFLFLAMATLTFAADLTGTWSFQVDTDMGSGTPTFTFKQEGSKLSGTYSGALGEAPVTGKIDGAKVEFWFEASPTGEKITVKYSGTIEGDNKMKGSVDLGGQAKGTFTAEKK